MSRILAITRAAYSTALTPSGASDEWQVCPRTITLNERLPLWPITTSISVGSPTKQAIGFLGAPPTFSRMRPRPPAPDHLDRALALVADPHIHLGRLADEAGDRLGGALHDLRDHAPHAPAAD